MHDRVEQALVGNGENIDNILQAEHGVAEHEQRKPDRQQLVFSEMQKGKSDTHQKIYIVEYRKDIERLRLFAEQKYYDERARETQSTPKAQIDHPFFLAFCKEQGARRVKELYDEEKRHPRRI